MRILDWSRRCNGLAYSAPLRGRDRRCESAVAIDSNPTLAGLVVNVEDDEAGKATRVGTPNVAQVDSILDQMIGVNAPVAVEYQTGSGGFLSGRYRNSGRMMGGDYINSDKQFAWNELPTGGPCTGGFGGMEPREGKPPRVFLLTAGHCATVKETEVWRAEYDGDYQFPYADAGKHTIGEVARITLNLDEYGGVRTDGTAVRIEDAGVVPTGVLGWGELLPTKPAGWARKGTIPCYSGAISKTAACGKVVARSVNYHPEGADFGLAGYWVRFPEDKRPDHGDSGGPVWKQTHRKVRRPDLRLASRGGGDRNARGALATSSQHGTALGAGNSPS